MEYIAGHYNVDLALAWALRLEGKTDQEKFAELNWGLPTWDLWNWNDCLTREIFTSLNLPFLFNWGMLMTACQVKFMAMTAERI